MNQKDFEKLLAHLPEEEPDAVDRAMIEQIDDADDSGMSLADFKDAVAYSGRLSIRIPKSLHKALCEAAKSENVSLNQYVLYRLSHYSAGPMR